MRMETSVSHLVMFLIGWKQKSDTTGLLIGDILGVGAMTVKEEDGAK